MTKTDKQQQAAQHVSGGAHLGGTRFGQQPGDAKEKDGHKNGAKGDKARPNDGQQN